jgi:spore germination protein
MKKLLIVTILLFTTACIGQSDPSLDKLVQPNKDDLLVQPLTNHPEHAPPINDKTEYQPIVHHKPTVEVLGFLDPSAITRATTNAKRFAPYLTYFAFFSYHATADGQLIPLQDDQPLHVAKQQGVTPMMVITNLDTNNYSANIAHSLFTNSNAFTQLSKNIISTMKAKGFRALNIDFEHIAEADRSLYNKFLATLIPIVKQHGFLVSTDLAPKTSDQQGGEWAGAHDYAFHGKIADIVVLMTYDWGYSEGPPNPIAPTPEISKVLDYAISRIPAKKIMMGLPLYGYDWKLPYKKGNPPANLVSPQEAIKIAQATGAKINYDNKAEVPSFFYKDKTNTQHQVWFENEQSAQAKFNLVKKYNLRGIAYWAISHRDFPRNWTLLDENFHVRK